MILNGSPRAPRSNSKEYAALFARYCPEHTEYFNITKSNHQELCQAMEQYSDVLLVFPLYADGIPVTLLNFLTHMERTLPQVKPTISVLINCGFYEPEQNDVAVEMIGIFCQQTGCPLGSVLKIGSGEAILATPFRFLVARKIRKLARAMAGGRRWVGKVTMPIPKTWFLRASCVYWENYGKRNGITKEQMETMKIEG